MRLIIGNREVKDNEIIFQPYGDLETKITFRIHEKIFYTVIIHKLIPERIEINNLTVNISSDVSSSGKMLEQNLIKGELNPYDVATYRVEIWEQRKKISSCFFQQAIINNNSWNKDFSPESPRWECLFIKMETLSFRFETNGMNEKSLIYGTEYIQSSGTLWERVISSLFINWSSYRNGKMIAGEITSFKNKEKNRDRSYNEIYEYLSLLPEVIIGGEKLPYISLNYLSKGFKIGYSKGKDMNYFVITILKPNSMLEKIHQMIERGEISVSS